MILKMLMIMPDRVIMNEKYSLIRQNYWTGLRVPDINKTGHNWMLYYCLIRLTQNKCPLDCIMYLINEYLNWIPAGCWKNASIFADSCVCGCGCWGGDIENVPIGFCSYSCLEKNRRENIINEWSTFSDILNLFKNYPIDAIQEAENILDDFNENNDHYNLPIAWIYNDSSDYDNSSDYNYSD